MCVNARLPDRRGRQVVAVFAVYALGVAIIGFYRSATPGLERTGFAVAAVLLSVPTMLLMPAETALGAAGVGVTLASLANDLALRGIGAVVFVGLLIRNARRAAGTDAGTPTPDAA